MEQVSVPGNNYLSNSAFEYCFCFAHFECCSRFAHPEYCTCFAHFEYCFCWHILNAVPALHTQHLRAAATVCHTTAVAMDVLPMVE